MEAGVALAHGPRLGHEVDIPRIQEIALRCAAALALPAISASVVSVAGTAHADEPADAAPSEPRPPDDAVMVRIRELYEKRDYVGVRRELLAAYEEYKHPSLLFALGQVELNLENYEAAIDYYEKFIATGPGEEQIALAQQAIGAARMRMVQPKEKPVEKPPPPPKPRVREWYRSDTIVVAAGGAAVAIGAGMFFYGRHLGNDHSDSLAAYDERTDRARAYQYTAAGLGAVGVVAAAVAVVRWRLRPHDEVAVAATGNGAVVMVRW